METTSIIKIQIDQSVILGSKKRVQELGLEISGLSAIQKEAKKNGEQLTEEYIERNAKIQALTKELRQNNEVLKNAATLQNTLGGSNDELRAKLSILTREYNKLSEEEREFTAKGKTMQGQIKAISDELKKNESAVGDNRRNVGNYKEAFSGLLGVFKQSGGALGAATEGAMGFNAALKANPILAVATVLIPLIKNLLALKPVADVIEQVVTAVNAAFKVTVGAIGDFIGAVVSGKSIFAAFSDSFSGLGSRIAETADQTYRLVKAQKDLEDAQRAQMITNAQDEASVKRLILQSKDRTKSIEERLKILYVASRIEKQNLEEQQKIAKEEERIASEKLRLAAENASDRDELEKAANEASVKRIQLESQSLDLQEKIENRRNALLQEREEKEAKAAEQRQKEIEKAAADQQKLLEQRKAAEEAGDKFAEDEFNKWVAREQEKLQLRTEFERNKFTEAYKSFLSESELLDKRIEEYRKAGVSEVELEKYKQAEIEKILNKAEADTADRNLKKIDEQAELAKAEIQLLELSEEKKTQLLNAVEQDRLNAKIAAINTELETSAQGDQKRTDELIKMKAALVEILRQMGIQIEANEENTAKKLADTAKAATVGTLTVAQNLVSGMQGVIQQNIKDIEEQARAAGKTQREIDALTLDARKEAKELAVAAAVIQTLQSAIAAYSSASAVPVVGVALGPIAAAAALVFGYKQVEAIRNQKLSRGGIVKAERGATFGIFGGKPHSQGGNKFVAEDGTVIETEKDELWAIVNKRSTNMLRNLSMLNQAGGGVPFGAGGIVDKFAGGGITGIANNLLLNSDNNAALSDGIAKIVPVLVLEELEVKQGIKVKTQQNLEL